MIDVDLVLPYLSCNNCEDSFKGKTVYGCAGGHTMCSLCLDEAYQEFREGRAIYTNGPYHPR